MQHPPSRTNQLARRLGLTGYGGSILMAAADGLPWYHANETLVLGIASLALGMMGLPTIRNIQENTTALRHGIDPVSLEPIALAHHDDIPTIP
jgi:hypothetical protein